jgi:hypothetical protein
MISVLLLSSKGIHRRLHLLHATRITSGTEDTGVPSGPLRGPKNRHRVHCLATPRATKEEDTLL